MMCRHLIGDLCRPNLVQSHGLFYKDSLWALKFALSCIFSAVLEDNSFEVS